MKKLKWQLYDIANGLWSNIPLCCIRFWIAGNNGITRKHEDPFAYDAQYVRCDKCIAKGHFNKIRSNGTIFPSLVGLTKEKFDSVFIFTDQDEEEL